MSVKGLCSVTIAEYDFKLWTISTVISGIRGTLWSLAAKMWAVSLCVSSGPGRDHLLRSK